VGRKTGSYKFEKRRKELEKKKKKAEKRERRLNKTSDADDDGQPEPSSHEALLAGFSLNVSDER